MNNLMLISVFIGTFCVVVSGSAVATVPTATNWFKYTYWNDLLCTSYAGEYSIGLGQCYLTQYGYVKYSGILDGVNTYELDSHFYKDVSCSQSSFNTSQFYAVGCTSGPGYFYTTSVVSAPSTSFASSGLLTSVYDSNADCTNSVGEMAYLFQVFNTSICYPWVNGLYLTAANCDTSYYSTTNTTCFNPATHSPNSPTTHTCTTSTEQTTEGGLIGYIEVSCLANPTPAPSFAPGVSASPSYSRSPTVTPTQTVAPTFSPTLSDDTMWLQYNYWSDSACTVFAGVQGGLGNACIRLNNGEYSNSSVTYSGGYYTVYTNLYTVGTCSGTPWYSYTSQYSAGCMLDGDHYYTSTLVNSVPTSFASNGALTILYPTYSDCVYQDAPVWYMFQVYGATLCYEYVNGYYTNTDTCGDFNICYSDDVYSITVNECPSTQSYVSATGAVGYPYTQCFGSGSSDDDDNSSGDALSPGTIAAIVVPVTVVLLGAVVGLYYYFVMVPMSTLAARSLAKIHSFLMSQITLCNAVLLYSCSVFHSDSYRL